MTQQDLDRLSWTSTDAKAWREFLQNPTGQRLLAGIALEEPELLDGADVNKTLVRSGEVRHQKRLVSFFLQLTGGAIESAPAAEPPAYPDLEDDSHWDGPKLNPN